MVSENRVRSTDTATVSENRVRSTVTEGAFSIWRLPLQAVSLVTVMLGAPSTTVATRTPVSVSVDKASTAAHVTSR